MNFILRIAGSLIAFVVFVKLGYVLYAKQSKIINSIMKHNFEMFLFHQQIIYVCLLSLNGILPPAIHAIFNFIISFILSYAISVGISKTKYLSKVIKKKTFLTSKKLKN